MNDLLKLATLIRRAYDMHNNSWVSSDGDIFGHYAVDKYEAIDRVAAEIDADETFIQPARLMLHWVNDATQWADKVLANAQLNSEASADIEALHDRHVLFANL